MLALFLAAYAGNKVESIAILKVTGIVFFLPMLSFFAAAPWHYPLGIIPMYWPTQVLFLERAAWWPHLIIGVVVHALFLRAFVARFGNRVL